MRRPDETNNITGGKAMLLAAVIWVAGGFVHYYFEACNHSTGCLVPALVQLALVIFATLYGGALIYAGLRNRRIEGTEWPLLIAGLLCLAYMVSYVFLIFGGAGP